MWRIVLAQIASLFATACILENLARPGVAASRAQRFEFSEIHMGTRFRIVLYARNARLASVASRIAFDHVAALDATMSDYRDTSELNRVCDLAAARPIVVSDDLFQVLSHAQHFSEVTEGAFDVTAGPLVRLWRRARRTGELPEPDRLSAARGLTGYRMLRLDTASRAVSLDKEGMRIDLGGIAKGYAADRALEDLRRVGIKSALVAAGGDIALGAAPPGREGWRVEVLGLGAKPFCALLLKNGAVSTSGDSWQYAEIDGVRYSHIIDPRTGRALTGRRSATVVASDGASADALATAVCVLGFPRGLQVADSIGMAALFQEEDAGVPATRESVGWSRLRRVNTRSSARDQARTK